ncbi:DUF423 domain-containing protein [Pelagibacterium montanilacus]|uniref:DUF423 domain-containing protein n=1 Tax=Pelagibacterium montanilacus TaxID=2185280 RepID=UPI000F8CC85F|nr:DUF423 domain-containing protein [Pelagibacterium montanilacus]
MAQEKELIKPAPLLLVAAGLLGAAGVGAAAAANHAGGALLAPLSQIALTHAPALIALGLLGGSRLLRGAGFALALGAIVFCADLGTRHVLATPLFPMAAPLGGGMLIAGWALVALGGLTALRTRNRS